MELIKDESAIKNMRKGGEILARILNEISRNIQAGTTTIEIENSINRLCLKYGVKPAFKGYQPAGSKAYGFYGLSEKGGLSQGHSDAVRRIKGVKDARQYTHAISETIERVRQGDNSDLTKGEMHWREVYVVLENDTPEERARVEEAIKTDKDYFAPYKTVVNFVKEGELSNLMPHDGVVVASGITGKGNKARIEYQNYWESNPEATGNILVACARACHRLNSEGKTGAFTMLDISPAYYSPLSQEDLLKHKM